MPSLILASAPIREQFKCSLQHQCETLKQRGVTPFLKVFLVGHHPPSLLYTKNKKKFIESIGGQCEILNLPENIDEALFLQKLASVGQDSNVHGILIQLPLPAHLSHLQVGKLIPASKDVDGFHPYNLFDLLLGAKGEDSLIPCTPKGVVTLLKYYNIELKGKNIAMIGRSMIVGKPMSLLLKNYQATITVCHSYTQDLRSITKAADIVVSAIGRPRFLDGSYFRNDGEQIVIDIGINQDHNGQLCGDVDFEAVAGQVKAITPVPGGIGPMTILSLAQNLILATEIGLKL